MTPLRAGSKGEAVRFSEKTARLLGAAEIARSILLRCAGLIAEGTSGAVFFGRVLQPERTTLDASRRVGREKVRRI